MYKLLRFSPCQLDAVQQATILLGNASRLGYTTSTSNSPINIPKRKPRGPTDILQTLSNTIGRDPTAAHYKYHDDPFLIPMSNVGKRTFALAQEAGRKAAKWIVNENSHLFNHTNAEPPIEVFAPKVVYDEKSQVGEETLLKTINDGNVSDSLIIYGLLGANGTEISQTTKQALLELVCFTNEEDMPSEELIEERWFTHSKRTKNSDNIIMTWKNNGVADTIMKSLSPPTPEAYSTIIQGMAKFGQIDRAWQYYEACNEKGLNLDVGAYNALLSVVNAIKQSPELRLQLIQDLLSRMATAKISPNLNTLNAVLFSISGMGGQGAMHQAFTCLAEFRSLGIEPCLASYYLILQTITRERGQTVNQGKVVSDILDRLENQSLEIKHPLDTRFFVKAMEVCRYGAQDITLARRVDDLLHQNNNYDLIGDSFEESVYYRNYFMLLCSTETMDNIMEVYNTLVPNIYTPEPAVLQELIKVADVSGDLEQLPRLWTDIVSFDHNDREPLLTQMLDALVRNEPAQDSPFNATFAEIAVQIWDKVENQPANRVNVISWSAEMLSNIMILSARSGNLEMASRVMKKLSKEQSYLGEPHIEALCSYMDLCIAKNDFNKALICLSFCKESGRAEVTTMAKDLRSRLTLSDDEAQQLSELLADS